MSATDTVIGLDKFRVFDGIGYVPHQSQRLIHAHNARMKVVTAGRRFGKSELGGHELVPEALLTYTMKDDLKRAGKRREFWIVGPEYSDSEKEFRVIWNKLEAAEVPLDHPGSYNSPWAGEMSISAFGGRFLVAAKSAKYPGTLVGEGLSGVILAEAAKLKATVWHKFIRPTLADYRGWALFTTTPEGKNWLYELWMRGQDPTDPSWASWRMPSWANDYVFPDGASDAGIAMLRKAIDDPEIGLTPQLIEDSGVDSEIVDMLRDMTAERFNQEIAAMFTEYVGRVFKDFDEETHVTSCAYDPRLEVHLATDYGFRNPFVALAIQVDVFGNIYVLAEHRRVGVDIEDIAAELKTERNGLFAQARKLYPDPASPGDSAVLVKHLKLIEQGGTGGELKWRLELIRQALKLKPEHGPWEMRKPKLFIDRSCKELIREMNDYRYPETKEEVNDNKSNEHPENPLKKDDHGPEALGRFFRAHFGAPDDSDSGGRAKVSRAKVSA
jgi:hypothetical protein